jgi:hypothetical protein
MKIITTMKLFVTDLDQTESSPHEVWCARPVGVAVPDEVQLFGQVFEKVDSYLDPETKDIAGWKYTCKAMPLIVFILD